MFYLLDTVETRILSYEMAIHHKLNMPVSWEARQIAVKIDEWISKKF